MKRMIEYILFCYAGSKLIIIKPGDFMREGSSKNIDNIQLTFIKRKIRK